MSASECSPIWHSPGRLISEWIVGIPRCCMPPNHRWVNLLHQPYKELWLFRCDFQIGEFQKMLTNTMHDRVIVLLMAESFYIASTFQNLNFL